MDLKRGMLMADTI